ncbi:MAG: hypothetical protein K0Q59_394 [Paenibacillus sp.]|nr:hypothetical protein [Paenibacillus sp.]
MTGIRMIYMESWTFYWLIVPNLLLAWIPLVASQLALRTAGSGGKATAVRAGWLIAWLAFYPNASYIMTDLIHITWASTVGSLYYDLFMTLFAAMLGWLLGALSLYMLHTGINRRWSERNGMLFAAIVVLLGSIGVYLGRVLRFNSWDLIVRPGRIAADVVHLATQPKALLFIAAFAVFTGAMYALFYKLMRLGQTNVK